MVQRSKKQQNIKSKPKTLLPETNMYILWLIYLFLFIFIQINFKVNSLTDVELIQEIKTIMSYLFLTLELKRRIRNCGIIQGSPVIRTQVNVWLYQWLEHRWVSGFILITDLHGMHSFIHCKRNFSRFSGRPWSKCAEVCLQTLWVQHITNTIKISTCIRFHYYWPTVSIAFWIRKLAKNSFSWR